MLVPALMIVAPGCSSLGTGEARVVNRDEQSVVIAVPEYNTRTARQAERLAESQFADQGGVVFVKSEEWAAGERWDWSAIDQALVQSGGRYDNRFRTHPGPQTPASLTFAVLGEPSRSTESIERALERIPGDDGLWVSLLDHNIAASDFTALDENVRRARGAGSKVALDAYEAIAAGELGLKLLV